MGGGERRKGRVIVLDKVKGFGFIAPDDGGDDMFFHRTFVRSDGFNSLGHYYSVEFEVDDDITGPYAVDVSGPNGCSIQERIREEEKEREQRYEDLRRAHRDKSRKYSGGYGKGTGGYGEDSVANKTGSSRRKRDRE